VAKRRSRAEWRRIIETYEATGGTHAAYAEAHGLGLASFRKWLYAFRASRVPMSGVRAESPEVPLGAAHRPVD
jgi:transposase-like protein